MDLMGFKFGDLKRVVWSFADFLPQILNLNWGILMGILSDFQKAIDYTLPSPVQVARMYTRERFHSTKETVVRWTTRWTRWAYKREKNDAETNRRLNDAEVKRLIETSTKLLTIEVWYKHI